MPLKSKKQQICFPEFTLMAFAIIIPLIILKQAYDYTLIKLNTAHIFLLITAVYFYIKNRNKKNVISGAVGCCGNFGLHNLFLRLFYLFLFFYLVVCFISVLTSPYMQVSLNALYRIVTYIGIMLVVSYSITTQNIRRVIAAWLVSSVFVSGYGLYQAVNHKTVASTFGNPNFMAAYLVLILPVAVCWISYWFRNSPKPVHTGSLGKLFLLIAVTVILLAGLIVSKARGSWFGLAFSGIVPGFLILFPDKKKLVIFSGIIILCLIICGTVFGPALFGQLSADVRPMIWKGTLNMIKAAPLIGHGLGTFFISYPGYRLKEYFLHPQNVDITRHSHCEYLETASETGLIGLFVFGVIVILFLYIAAGAIRKSRDIYSKYMLAGLTGGLAGFLVHNLMSVNMRFPSCAIFFWFSMGLALGLIKKTVENERELTDRPSATGALDRFFCRMCTVIKSYWNKQNNNIKGIITIIPVVIVMFITLHSVKTDLLAHIYLKKGVKHRAQKKYVEAITCYRKAIVLAPYFITPYYKMAYSYAAIGDVDSAIQTYEKILSLAPDYASVRVNLGLLYSRKTDYETALSYLKKAQESNPYDKTVLMELALICLRQGKEEEAAGYLRSILRFDPEDQKARYKLTGLTGT